MNRPVFRTGLPLRASYSVAQKPQSSASYEVSKASGDDDVQLMPTLADVVI